MINSDKIGNFIAELRNNKKLSQEKLGKLLGIGRDSISKWERGVTLPSHEMLLKLSDVFNVTVNEILYGEILNKQNEKEVNEVSAILYEDVKNGKKIIKRLSIIIVCIIAFLGIYYFINSYKSIKVYTISSSGNYAFIDNGVFIKTRGKIYFSINEIKTKKELNIKKITLYYKNIENVIYSGDNTNILISQYYGENEYFETDYFKDIDNNLYLFLEYDNGGSETIKLLFTQDYINNDLFFKKEKQTITQKNNDELDIIPTDLNPIINMIKKTYKEEDNTYKYNKKDEDLEYSSYYLPDSGIIGLVISKDGNSIEDWIFYTYGKSLSYTAYDGKEILYSFIYENENVSCSIGTCENEEKKIEYFWSYLYELI